MTDIVKESVFNTLAPRLHRETRFLDLFSGTGSLSLEALSRGAKQAIAVESNYEATQIIKNNRKLLTKPSSLLIKKQDVFRFIPRYRGEPFDIIIADPPFALNAGQKLLEALVKSHLYIKGTCFIIEISRQEEMEEKKEHFSLFNEKIFGDKKVRFYHVT